MLYLVDLDSWTRHSQPTEGKGMTHKMEADPKQGNQYSLLAYRTTHQHQQENLMDRDMI